MNDYQQQGNANQQNDQSNTRKGSSGFFTRVMKTMHINKKSIKILFIVFMLAAVGFFAYQYVHTRNELNKAKNPDQAAKQETQDILNDIGKYLELPNSEQPTMATVSNKEKLKSQPFFENAENGDKVLVYTKAQQAILYRPSTKKVIEYAPVNPAGSQSTKP